MSLYIISTPIGNLSDITLRALEVLKSVDFVLCEDTRETKKLLDKYDINVRTVSFHQHTDQKKLEEIIEEILFGKSAAYVTDAGTPNISDPGSALVRAAVEKNIQIVPIPGSSALTAALSISAIDVSRFIFLGFPPVKKGRKTFFEKLAVSEYPVVIYESCHRIKKTLQEISEFDKMRKVEVFRELTKKFESVYRGAMSKVIDGIVEKGEFVIILNGLTPARNASRIDAGGRIRNR